jgi:phosphoglycerate kinase
LALRTINDVNVSGKKVLVRVDFNVPLDITGRGTITDDSRIKAALPTINYLVARGAKVILCSHLGRPKGKFDEKLRMAPVAERLSQLIGSPVVTVRDCIGKQVQQAVDRLKEGEVLLLENVRFHPEEEQNDAEFARALAGIADIYVNDAFGTAHRAHASTVGVAKFLPAYSGFLMQKELECMHKILDNPEHPFAAIMGGAKVSDKIDLIKNIVKKIEFLLIGGGMAVAFLKMQGYATGKSMIEVDKEDILKQLINVIENSGVKLILPLDVVVADEIDKNAAYETVFVNAIPDDRYIVDIGPETIRLFNEPLNKCLTIFWNGPMGIYEIEAFSRGTRELAEIVANEQSTTVIGGGSTAEIVEELKLTDRMTHVSTGGGASLKFLEGKTLPGVAVLQDN